MKLGAYTACLHDKPVAEALQTLRDLGLDSAEINSGGFLPAPHLPIEQVRASQDARERLATEIGATHVGAEMDPSHLFWQGIDPVTALERLGGLVYNAAAKDTRINEAAKVNGVLDDRFGRVAPDDPGAVSLGGRYTLSRWPERSSWDFVAVGRGHDVDFWTGFLQALRKIDPDMAVNIEHEDQELDQMEGLRYAAETLRTAAARLT